MNIDFNKNEDNTAQIEVTVEPQDYKDSLETELKSYQKKTNLKGFRKGKTPKSMIRKMYGPALLTDIINKKLQNSLNEFLEKENLDILGQPIPAEDQKPHDFRLGEDLSYSFKFDLGLKPEFEIAGLSESYHFYETVISDDEVDKQIETLRRRGGSREEVEKEFEEEDIISFNAHEMEDGEIKENGLETAFDVMVDTMEEEFKEVVLKSEVGEMIDFDIFKVEQKMSEEGVRKHLMNLEEEDADREVNHQFRGEIVNATRLVLADLDEDFLTMAFGEDVTTVEAARELIKKDLKGHFDAEADSLLFQEVHDKMMAETEIEMPDEFLKRWMFYSQNNSENESEPVSLQKIEENYEGQFKESLRWQLISDKLLKKHEVTVEEEEILEELGRRIQQYMPGQQLNQAVYNQILQSLAQDQKQVQDAHNQIRTNKIFVALKPDLALSKKEISQEAFEEKLNEIQKANQEKQAARLSEEVESDDHEEE